MFEFILCRLRGEKGLLVGVERIRDRFKFIFFDIFQQYSAEQINSITKNNYFHEKAGNAAKNGFYLGYDHRKDSSETGSARRQWVITEYSYNFRKRKILNVSFLLDFFIKMFNKNPKV